MLEKLALRLKAYWAVCEYRGGHTSPSELIRRPLKDLNTLSPEQRRTRLLTSLAIVEGLHKAGHLCADALPSSCQEIVEVAPEKERYELVNIALRLGALAYKHPRMPLQSLLNRQKKLIELLPPSERLVPVSTVLDLVKKHGNIDGDKLRSHLWDLADLLPKDQRQEVVDFGIKCDMAAEKEMPTEPEVVLRNRVFYIYYLAQDQRDEAAQRYGLWNSASAAWKEFAGKENGDYCALLILRNAFAICGAPPPETGITGVTISEKFGKLGLISTIFEREKGLPVAVVGTDIVTFDNMQILAGDAPVPPWLGPYAPAEREFIRQNLPKLSAPAAA